MCSFVRNFWEKFPEKLPNFLFCCMKYISTPPLFVSIYSSKCIRPGLVISKELNSLGRLYTAQIWKYFLLLLKMNLLGTNFFLKYHIFALYSFKNHSLICRMPLINRSVLSLTVATLLFVPRNAAWIWQSSGLSEIPIACLLLHYLKYILTLSAAATTLTLNQLTTLKRGMKKRAESCSCFLNGFSSPWPFFRYGESDFSTFVSEHFPWI